MNQGSPVIEIFGAGRRKIDPVGADCNRQSDFVLQPRLSLIDHASSVRSRNIAGGIVFSSRASPAQIAISSALSSLGSITPSRCSSVSSSPRSGTNSPHCSRRSSISAINRSQSARFPSRCNNSFVSERCSTASFPPNCIRVRRAASRYSGAASSTGASPPPLPESTGSDRAISMHTESMVWTRRRRGLSSNPHPSASSRRSTPSARLSRGALKHAFAP